MKNEKTEKHVVEKQDNNPLNPVDKQAKRIEPAIETDTFTDDEQKEIVRMVIQDAESDIEGMAEWVQKQRKNLKMYNGDKPSVIENLTKEDWQSDRNLRLTTATCDAYQATLLATCFNPDTIHVKATEANDVNHKDDTEEFIKWGVGPSESNIFTDVGDFIQTRIIHGFSVFKVYWKVWYEWVDRRIPKYGKPIAGKPQFEGFEIETEKVRFERGIIENIPDVEDILTPTHGKDIQSLNHFIHVIHLDGQQVIDYADRDIFTNIDEKYVEQLRGACFDSRIKVLGKEKAEALGLVLASDITVAELRQFPIDVYEWYGTWTKNGRTEKYRFVVEPIRRKFLAGKPLREVPGCRNGKIPFAGGALRRVPGQIRGEGLPSLVADVTNAFNNTFNQKSDFQYVENCPIGFYKPDENYDKQTYKLIPGSLYPSQDPKNINIPNHSRSMAWAESDVNILLQMIERLTGAASYFQSRDNQSKTLGQDLLIEKNSDTRFGLWVKFIIADIAEAITMWLNMYQDCAPSTLSERVLGEEGDKLFPNMSIETLRGGYDAYLTPDVVAGSKMYEKQLATFALQSLPTMMWLNPQINARGNWQLTVDSLKRLGFMNIESYFPPKPPGELGSSKEVDKIWARFMQGEIPDVDENMNVVEIATGLVKKISENYYKLDKEYRPNVDNYMLKLSLAMQRQFKRMQEESIAAQIAQREISQREGGFVANESPALPAPGQAPISAPAAMPGQGGMPNA